MDKARDRMWLWGHVAMKPPKGAYSLGIPNICMCWDYTLPIVPLEEQRRYAMAFKPFPKVVWSVTGLSSAPQANDDINSALTIAEEFPNVCGVVMDDFFGQKTPYSLEELEAIKNRLVVNEKRLPLWVVYYEKELHMSVEKSLLQFDVVTFWTWTQENLKDLEENFTRMERMSPGNRKMLGCYLYDFGGNKEMQIPMMEKQCDLGLRWLRQGKIDGMIFCTGWGDSGAESVEWTRDWIAKIGEEKIG